MVDGARGSVANKRNSAGVVLLILVLLLAAAITWWYKVYMNTDQVFWGMIDNNLASTGVTRHFTQGDQMGSVDQYIKLQFGATDAVNSVIVYKQDQNNIKATAKSETIGTPKADYSRYISINTTQKNSQGKPLDTSKVVGVWAKAGSTPQYLKQNVFSLIPYGNFSRSQRDRLIKMMRDKNVYNITGVKSARVNSQSVYVYDVTVKPKVYIDVMLAYSKELGLDAGIDASQYENAQALKVQVSIDKVSRNLVRLNYPSTKQVVDYVSHGIEEPITIPSHTISDAELQKRIQKSLQ